MCHNATNSDQEKRERAKGSMPPESIHLKRFIHRLHTGHNLGEPFIVYGGPAVAPVPISFGEVRFPGDRRNCTKCHEHRANEIPLPAGVLETQMPQADGSIRLITPIMSACFGCHTREPARAHMEAQIHQGTERAALSATEWGVSSRWRKCTEDNGGGLWLRQRGDAPRRLRTHLSFLVLSQKLKPRRGERQERAGSHVVLNFFAVPAQKGVGLFLLFDRRRHRGGAARA